MPIAESSTQRQEEEYILDENDANFPSYGVLREGGTLVAGNEESETLELLNAVAENLPIRIPRGNDPVNEQDRKSGV